MKTLKKYLAIPALAAVALYLSLPNTAAFAEGSAESAAATNATAKNIDRAYDLFIMSMCPYGTRAVGDLTALLKAFPRLTWNVWFIGTVDGDRMSSLRGEPEMADEKLWLAVNALYPARYFDFLVSRAASQSPTESLLEEMGLDLAKIRQWAKDSGTGELRRHYLLSMQKSVNASPTLFINGAAYDKRIIGGRLVREECNSADTQPAFCIEYPDCFDDGDCKKPGKLGRCIKTESDAACEFRDDAAFSLTALVADSALDSPEKPIIDAITGMLPGAKVNIVKFSTAEGQKLMAEYAPAALPFIHFENSVTGAFRFQSIKGNLEEIKTPDGKVGGFTVKKGAIKENYFPLRGEKPGLIELYADPMMSDAGQVINAVLSDPKIAKRVAIRPLLLDGSGENPAAVVLEKHRAEEALRWLVLAQVFPKQYHNYLKRYAEDPASTYWFKWLRPARVNPRKFLRHIGANREKIAKYREYTADLTSGGESVFIMINNRTRVTAANEAELERILGEL